MGTKSYDRVIETVSSIALVMVVLSVIAGFARLLSNDAGFIFLIAFVVISSVSIAVYSARQWQK